MSLDVYLRHSTELPPNGNMGEYVVSIEGTGRDQNDGYFWFLYPLFNDLAKRTGQRIDLFGFAAFSSDTLDALEQTLISARVLVDAQPDIWERVFKVRRKSGWSEERQQLNKHKMIVLLENLNGAVHKARATGRYVFFFGD